MDLDHNAHPLNPLPGVVWLLALPIAVIEIALSLAGYGLIGGPAAVGWRLDAMQNFAFSTPIFQWMLANSYFPPEHLIRFVSYAFIHIGPTHAMFVVVFILALGKYVGEVFRPWAILLIFFASAILGALAYGLLSFSQMPLIGGYPPVYGLIGAFSFILYTRLGERGANRMGAFTLIGFFLGVQMFYSLAFGGSREWIADLAGFLTGFGLSFVVAPGGPARVVQAIRRR